MINFDYGETFHVVYHMIQIEAGFGDGEGSPDEVMRFTTDGNLAPSD